MAVYADKKNGKPTGRWVVEVQSGGARKRGRFDTKAEADTAEKQWRRAFALGTVENVEHRIDTRGAPRLLSQLLTKAAPLIWNGSAHGEDCQRKVRAIIEWCGDPVLAEVATTYVDDVVLKLRELGKAPATVNRYLSALHAVLKWGAAQGRQYVLAMPVFTWQDEDEGRIRVLTPAEEATLLAHLEENGRGDVADFVRVALDTGCRRGELLAAQPDQLGTKWLRLWADQTKTRVSRLVPLTARAKATLKRRLPWQLTEAQLRYWWDAAKEALGLTKDEDFVLHACRHTCATRLVEAGVNLRVIQRFLGHKSISTTERYAHATDEMLLAAAVRLGALNASPGETPDEVGGVGKVVGESTPEDALGAIAAE